MSIVRRALAIAFHPIGVGKGAESGVLSFGSGFGIGF
jgi:hypothetical protein